MAHQAAARAEMPDTEITLGLGKLLTIFFALVVVCGVFFALGYNLGRASVPMPDPSAAAASPTTNAANGGAKPSAVQPGNLPTAATTDANSTSPATTPANSSPAPTSTSTTDAKSDVPASVPATAHTGPSYLVQVAAVTHTEDAELLMNALKQKNYAAFIVSDQPDKLHRVQIGPFSDRKEAIALRERLQADGFNSIVK